MPLLATLWLLGPGPTPAAAQDINPDRPDLTTSAELVPAGSLQLETGIEYERDGDRFVLNGPSTGHRARVGMPGART